MFESNTLYFNPNCNCLKEFRFSIVFMLKLILAVFFIFSEEQTAAQYKTTNKNEIPSPLYDQISVLFLVESYGSFYVDVIYTQNNVLYVNVSDLFNQLKIACSVSKNGTILGGFIANERTTYLIDFGLNQIKVGGKIISKKNGLLKENGAIYLESQLFEEAFGISLKFNFRALSVQLKANFELPVVKELKQEKLRKNLLKIKGEQPIDTFIKRNYSYFKFGTADWSLTSTQSNSGIDYRGSLGIGTEFLYGETDIIINYDNNLAFDKKQLRYLWRWVDNDKKYIKQIHAGKIFNQTIASVYSPLLGISFSNSSTAVRKAKGFYTIKEMADPNWIVELYINNSLVDYTKTDASGWFVFKVPNTYGFTTITLKFYGPSGEVKE